jgi:DNA mismatch repair protein MutH
MTRRDRPQSIVELEIRARALAGHSVYQLATALEVRLPPEPARAKGFIGQLVELALGADPAAKDQPDFLNLGVELKTVPVDKHGKPVESTFCCSISMLQTAHEQWETSRLRRRLQHVLWLPVEASKLAPLPNRRFGTAILWTPSAAQEAALRADWEDHMGAIGSGQGAYLNARQGRVLQVRPKAAHARKRTLAPGDCGVEMALPLGFYLRATFTQQILMA